jgi:hypothetical protein
MLSTVNNVPKIIPTYVYILENIFPTVFKIFLISYKIYSCNSFIQSSSSLSFPPPNNQLNNPPPPDFFLLPPPLFIPNYILIDEIVKFIINPIIVLIISVTSFT